MVTLTCINPRAVHRKRQSLHPCNLYRDFAQVTLNKRRIAPSSFWNVTLPQLRILVNKRISSGVGKRGDSSAGYTKVGTLILLPPNIEAQQV